ncbi:hypothetical protein DICPUDRAFT_153453 [Dictyostelium purpureum]|uniref:Uncharacterized protein n=1 Tax=Dictyostelium purpureum TaxID=5786 RepID=F0ZNY5_DICPU|nr:uncharacterized protein DICPUDRAFT_153453 [Dictyostelium purpureum]EGC34346.1 hypothetical protein DICPUDRAFT_153453 [Dictyostelium purpureum]|eukprot:XP_003289139.1 hypothetical protein DICPUDRAFT_153453 [Dictyostelium purpureum]
MGFDIENNSTATPATTIPNTTILVRPQQPIGPRDTLFRYKLAKEYSWTGKFIQFKTTFSNYPLELNNYLPVQEMSNLICKANGLIEKERYRRIMTLIVFLIGYLLFSAPLIYAAYSGITTLVIAIPIVVISFMVFALTILIILDKKKIKKLDEELLDIETRNKYRGIIISFKRKNVPFSRALDFKATVYYPGYNTLQTAPQMYNPSTSINHNSTPSYIPSPYYQTPKTQESTPLLKQ